MKGDKMPIVLTRIDDRLIHGQVVMKWTKHVGATYIVVADDEAAADYLQKTLMKAATPAGMKSSVLAIKDAAEFLNDPKLAREKTCIIIREPKAVVDLINYGVNIEAVNVGNMHTKAGEKKLASWIYATDEDVECFKELVTQGVNVIAQWVPGEETIDLSKLV